jgi:TetR/AcrR family transcriptional regulator
MAQAGERKLQILQTLAEMLEAPTAEKITTAALAARLQVSEAALYRHFASKAQMYEGLIEFIESTLFGFINKLAGDGGRGIEQAQAITRLLLGFAEKNRGMTRMLTGEVLVHEKERLQARMNQLMDRLEASLRQALRIAASQGDVMEGVDPGVAANLILAYVQGRWQQFVKSGFKRLPLENWEAQWLLLTRSFTP